MFDTKLRTKHQPDKLEQNEKYRLAQFFTLNPINTTSEKKKHVQSLKNPTWD